MEIKEFKFRKDQRTITVPFPAKQIDSVKCHNCGFDGLASQLWRVGLSHVVCPICHTEMYYPEPIYQANGDLHDFNE